MKFTHLIVIAAVVTLTACNSSDNKNDKGTNGKETTTTADSTGKKSDEHVHDPNETEHEHHAH